MEMSTISSPQLLIALLVPLLGAFGVMLAGKDENIREGISSTASVILLLKVVSLIPQVLNKDVLLEYTIFTLFGENVLGDGMGAITVSLRADGMAMIFAMVASSLWTIAVYYSMGYMRGLDEHAQTRFNACFALAIFGAIGVAFSANLFTMYLFYEIVSVCTYPLVAHHQNKEGYDGARKYIVYLTTTAKFFLLPAMILIYVLTGTFDNATDIRPGNIAADTKTA